MQARCLGRLKKEAEDIRNNFDGVLELDIKDESQMCWHVRFRGAEGSVYNGEVFTLQFKFSEDYPIESPEVIFVGIPPEHEHVYSNGYICLSTLYSDWTPALKVSAVTMSILSMLSSAVVKQKPANDAQAVVWMKNKSPKKVNWMFEDDKC
ncbi:ubiquitin-conjugating enzyme [Stylonychia lemnae]|uniref:Ubiquitin-conjugating enzyme n=1 Tax=Stylonychia lemnae TaxID=5949 RepID=A0A078APW2_STYLE|nr:ubiquitin-conjugating enzyme [Stylonychia lemnae]|eukprot:CDW84204.1 ubiquitin-conjugating enzyme [Stylonychia lemnae]